jgi:hypothetical protein
MMNHNEQCFLGPRRISGHMKRSRVPVAELTIIVAMVWLVLSASAGIKKLNVWSKLDQYKLDHPELFAPGTNDNIEPDVSLGHVDPRHPTPAQYKAD